ncbi:CRISPR-associated protein, Cmr5 family [Methanococcus vannielii SB]|jgi:CRISPR-associated protein Cmr5|uniref:CRISPR type III-B/RAMP module-associated protein Cmr5 n=1 Tax=Methanococcus vannielii (strain ATCC 35089 / DSM 1224 / JCM 13029 / OCM 148 / SB) TaxID=406327 RepID=A6UNF0_METVS|nr:type III-B CRISPR module-associated protein Cmr5 [Methanococcus vannielii]ABR54022.1 CRISPR-associated protein, Cmr5 family [Methanococcus vannielii SB]
MGKKEIEKYIPQALQLIGEHIASNGKVDNEYSGYISSFGASIIQSGLIPAVAFYSQPGKEGNVKDNRNKLMNVIYCLIHEKDNCDNKLLNDVISGTVSKEEVLDAAIATKLALRTFERVEPKKGENNDK